MAYKIYRFRGATPTTRPLFQLTAQMLAQTPAWPEHEPNPPISIRRSIRLGADKLRQLVECEVEWELIAAELNQHDDDRWFYRLHYQQLRDRDGNWLTIMGKPYYMPIIILMDGVTLDPIGEHDEHLWRPESPYCNASPPFRVLLNPHLADDMQPVAMSDDSAPELGPHEQSSNGDAQQ